MCKFHGKATPCHERAHPNTKQQAASTGSPKRQQTASSRQQAAGRKKQRQQQATSNGQAAGNTTAVTAATTTGHIDPFSRAAKRTCNKQAASNKWQTTSSRQQATSSKQQQAAATASNEQRLFVVTALSNEQCNSALSALLDWRDTLGLSSPQLEMHRKRHPPQTVHKLDGIARVARWRSICFCPAGSRRTVARSRGLRTAALWRASLCIHDPAGPCTAGSANVEGQVCCGLVCKPRLCNYLNGGTRWDYHRSNLKCTDD